MSTYFKLPVLIIFLYIISCVSEKGYNQSELALINYMWDNISSEDTDFLKDLTEKDAAQIYIESYEIWLKRCSIQPNEANVLDLIPESKVNQATSMKYCFMNENEWRNTATFLNTLGNFYCRKISLEKENKADYLRRILVLAYHFKQSRNFKKANELPAFTVWEKLVLIYYFDALSRHFDDSYLKKIGYNSYDLMKIRIEILNRRKKMGEKINKKYEEEIINLGR